MVKSLITIAMLVTTTSMAQASYICAVNGENPQKPGTYDQGLKYFNGDLEVDKAVFLYDNGTNLVSALKTPTGSIQLASFQKGTRKIDAMAVAKSESIILIDGKNSWSIICQEK